MTKQLCTFWLDQGDTPQDHARRVVGLLMGETVHHVSLYHSDFIHDYEQFASVFESGIQTQTWAYVVGNCGTHLFNPTHFDNEGGTTLRDMLKVVCSSADYLYRINIDVSERGNQAILNLTYLGQKADDWKLS